MAELPDVNLARQITRESHVDAVPGRPDTKKSYSGYSDEKAGRLDDEKGGVAHTHETDHEEEMQHYIPGDPFPVDPNAPEEEHQLTIRALIVGCALGAVVGASNIYLGLKTGFTFGPQLFGAIFGFAIIKPLSQFFTNNTVLPHWLWGGEFGPKENVCVQTAATSAGGLGAFSFANHERYLVFPTPSATAFTIRSLHSGKTGAIVARKKSLCLLITLLAALAYKVATGYAPGVLFDWHIGWTLYRLGWTSIIALENYGWWLESVAVETSDEFPLKSIQAMKFKTFDDYVYAPSPRYWLLWPGVLIMLTIHNRIERYRNRNDPNFVFVDEGDNDPCPPEDRVPNYAWIGALAVSMLLSITLISTQFNMNVGEVILANILGFIFSFIGVQSAGDTDINPISTVAKASQLIFGGIAKGQHLAQIDGMRLNLIGGIVAGGAAAQSTDMTGDLKTGHLIGAKPKVQFVSQLVGSTVASFLTVGLFVLFTKASPCILYPPEDGQCAYGAPSVSAWAAVATAVTAPKLPIPPSSGYTAIGLSILAAICVVAKHLWIPRKYWHWVPNWNAIGLGFVVPQTFYAVAMGFGSIMYYAWEIKNPAQFDMYGFPLAAGLLAGEGLGGVVQALLTVAGVGGDGVTRGTSVGCPGFEFCG
ncbi:hypothetical protein M407DRAFT_228119 [Tulasnella calospora MUT 4182]|uniref:OPT superfamily oligopeptide transporter n=1 Tax=Tulasnella calospora MUT 4182 TaxID=1051891 RepID=A0A0C3Q442_9AGAM|nr:hypothetical protein M407DRAFT_228119 [Tulasnella calospora MUT 4182]